MLKSELLRVVALTVASVTISRMCWPLWAHLCGLFFGQAISLPLVPLSISGRASCRMFTGIA